MKSKNFALFKTRLGWMGIIGSDIGISRIILPQESPDDVQTLIDAANTQRDENAFTNLAHRLIQYLNGDIIAFSDKLDLNQSTAFERKVWQTAQKIPFGQTRSYSWIAKQIGNPNAARAVGQALGKNPIPILIPCHRVIQKDGSLGGFSGGIDMKKRLLYIENESTIT